MASVKVGAVDLSETRVVWRSDVPTLRVKVSLLRVTV